MSYYLQYRIRYRLILHLVDVMSRFHVMLPASYCIIQTSDDEDTTEHDGRPIHMLDIGGDCDWEERSHSRYDDIENRKSIDRNTDAP